MIECLSEQGSAKNGRRFAPPTRVQKCPLELKGVMQMQFVTYENLFTFVLVLTSVIGMVLAILKHKK